MRLLFDRVEAQPIVMMPPRIPEPRAGFEDQRLDAALFEAGGGRQPRRSGAYDQDRNHRCRRVGAGGHGANYVRATVVLTDVRVDSEAFSEASCAHTIAVQLVDAVVI